MTANTKPVCAHCGSEEVSNDAAARWDMVNQDWSLSCTYDKAAHCDECDGETRLDWVEVPAPTGEPAAPTAQPPAPVGIAAAPFAIFQDNADYVTVERHDGPSPVRWTVDCNRLAAALEAITSGEA